MRPALLSAAASFCLACAETTPDGPPLTDIWSTLPTLEGTTYREWSSHERGSTPSFPQFPHGNKDFNNFIAVCGAVPSVPWQVADEIGPCEPSLRGYVIAAEDAGPGVVSRMYFTAGPVAPPSRATFGEERVRIYVDDFDAPLFETKLSSWHTGSEPAFRSPLSRYLSGAMVTYRPIPYQKRLRILLDNLRTDSIYYYHIDARSNLTRPVQTAEAIEFMAANSASLSGQALTRISFADRELNLEPGRATEVFERDRAGTIQLLSVSVLSADETAGKEVRLQIGWDDAADPAIDLPLATLFAGRQENKAFRTLPMSVEKQAGRTIYSLMLPMPFERAVRVGLHNAGSTARTARVRIEGAAQVPAGNFGKLHTTWSEQTGPFTPAQRFTATKRSGRGKFVGLIMFMDGRGKADGRTPHPVSFLEGDSTLVVDGRTMQGTGTEDYFNAGFYFQEGPYEFPFGALVRLHADLELGTGQITVVRWNLLEESVEFERDFELIFEYGAYEPLAAQQYGAVGFYYVR
jgi:hypothetical protein